MLDFIVLEQFQVCAKFPPTPAATPVTVPIIDMSDQDAAFGAFGPTLTHHYQQGHS